MKIQNPTKLDILFKGGGIIKFPFKHLKEVDIDGDSDEQSGGEGGGSAELTKLDTIKNYVNILYDHYNIEFDVIEETSTQEEEVTDENEEPTDEVITTTYKNYKFVPKTSIPKVYLNGNENSYTTASDNGELQLHSVDNRNSSNLQGISKIMLDDTELTVQQLKSYDVVQVGTAKFPINAPDYNYDDYAGYLEYLDWVRNNITEIAEIPILLRAEPGDGTNITKAYSNYGLFIPSYLFLNGNDGYYSQSVGDVIEQES